MPCTQEYWPWQYLTDQQLSILHDVMKHYKGNDAVRADIQLMPMWIRKILIKILNDIEKQ